MLNFKAANQKSATVVASEIVIEFVPSWPIFEKCSHLRDNNRGALMLTFQFSYYADHNSTLEFLFHFDLCASAWSKEYSSR